MSAKKTRTISHRTAVHEAGHAVVAVLEGQRFANIAVGATGAASAVVQDISYRHGDDELIRIALAGIMAARLIRRSWRHPFLDTAFDDIGIVADFVRNSGKVDFLLGFNIPHTETRLLTNWAAVTKIAKLFRRQRVVSYDDARAVVEDSKRNSLSPDGRLGDDRWRPLEEKIRWRIKYPRGLVDVFARCTLPREPSARDGARG